MPHALNAIHTKRSGSQPMGIHEKVFIAMSKEGHGADQTDLLW